MPPSFPIDKAYLIGGWSAAALWGIFTCMMTVALVQLVQLYSRGKMSRSRWITTAATIILYGLSTAHVGLELRRLIVGFIDIGRPRSPAYFADIAQPLNRSKDMVYITSMVIADAVVAWRCCVVWDKNKYVTTLLVILILGTITAGYGAISQYFLIHPKRTEALAFGNAMFAVSLTTNILVTTLTVLRIWWMSRTFTRHLGKTFRNKYRLVLLLLIESGVVIAISKVIEFSLFRAVIGNALDGFNALYVVFDMIPQINGIMPTLIIIGVNANMGYEETTHAVSTFRATGISVNSTTIISTSPIVKSSSSIPTGRTEPVFVSYKRDTFAEDIPMDDVPSLPSSRSRSMLDTGAEHEAV
ncbi:hypothetical protein BDW22DRAFT_1352879 [Trametopsis cervina]|nr:hypothetical protein BDW22DRAFT_1352879 [Trametopsis cervina]